MPNNIDHAEEYGSNPIPFIFEGKTAGKGTIKLVLRTPKGWIESSSEVHVELKEVERMKD